MGLGICCGKRELLESQQVLSQSRESCTLLCVTEVISTGSLRLDIALGIGGAPRGHIIEISGPASSGKTTLCQHIIAEAQKSGGICAYIDADHSLDPRYAARCGVDVDRLYISEPEYAEQALQMAEILARSGALAVLAVDSVSALVPQSEIAGDSGESAAGLEDRLISQALRNLSTTGRKTNTAVILTTRTNLRKPPVYHNLADNPARLALKLYASLRLSLQPVRLIRENGQITGNQVQIEVLKNKFATLFHTIELDIMYNEGISKSGELLDLGTQLLIISRLGSAYYYRGLPLGEGRETALCYLRQHASLSTKIERVIRQKLLPPALMAVKP